MLHYNHTVHKISILYKFRKISENLDFSHLREILILVKKKLKMLISVKIVEISRF